MNNNIIKCNADLKGHEFVSVINEKWVLDVTEAKIYERDKDGTTKEAVDIDAYDNGYKVKRSTPYGVIKMSLDFLTEQRNSILV